MRLGRESTFNPARTVKKRASRSRRRSNDTTEVLDNGRLEIQVTQRCGSFR